MATTRRPRGTGTIQRTDDGRFRARFAFDGTTREEIDGSPFATREEAASALDGVLLALASQPVDGITLLRLGEKALNRREKEGYRSIDDDRNRWKTHVEPWDLASMPAKTITRGDVRDLLASLRNAKTKEPLATSTKKNVRNLLSAVFAYGCEAELLASNPCRDLRIKSAGTTLETSTFLTLDEANALIEASTDPVVAIAIGTGMRSGELRALLWKDVHVDGPEPHVVVRFGKPDETTKNNRIRHVPLFGIALATFAALKAKRAALVAATPEDERDELPSMVFPSQSGWFRAKGRVVVREDWSAWKTTAKLERRVRFHDLRHTCATLLLSGAWGRSWSYEEVKEVLGHSSVKVTERYAHAVGTLASRAAHAMRTTTSRTSTEPSASAPTADRKARVRPEEDASIMAQASRIIERCRWDLNPHMPVLQTGRTARESRDGRRVRAFIGPYAEAYARAVITRDPHAHARGLDLAEAVLEAEAPAVDGSKEAAS